MSGITFNPENPYFYIMRKQIHRKNVREVEEIDQITSKGCGDRIDVTQSP